MPSMCCHPQAPHKKLRVPDWFASSLMMDRALDAIIRRVKKLDRKHDVPYLAGYSNDGQTIYIDRHLPRTFSYNGREIEVARYLILHEEVEKTLIDQLGLHYLHAHQIATRAEEAAVRAEKISWREYDRFMQKYVKGIGDERLTKVPADLDLKPYRDYHDYDLMRGMLKAIDKGQFAKAEGDTKMRDEMTRYTKAFKEQDRRTKKLSVAAPPIAKVVATVARKKKALVAT